MASRISNSSSNANIKIIRQQKSKEDIKRESEELILRLRKASMQRMQKASDKESANLEKTEDSKERNERIFKALYATPYDESNEREGDPKCLSNQGIGEDISLNCNSSPYCLPENQIKDQTNVKVFDLKYAYLKVTRVSEKHFTKEIIVPKEYSSLLNVSNDLDEKESHNEIDGLSSTIKEDYSNETFTPNEMISPERNVLPPQIVSAPVRKSIDPRIESEQNENHSMPCLATISSSQTFSFPCNPSLSFNSEDRSVYSMSQCEATSGDVTHGHTTDAVGEGSYESKCDIPYITFNCINAFTKKHQFKIMHREDTFLDELKYTLKKQYNFIGHLFYNGKELVGDDKMLVEFHFPLECELEILPQVVSGDYNYHEYSQILDEIEVKKQFLKNITNLMNNTTTVESVDKDIKKAIAKFETMTDSQRKKFDDDIKEKFAKLKEKRDSNRLNKKSYFLTSVDDKNDNKKNTTENVLPQENNPEKKENSI
uniref:Ubiquitin-like domain-containing protein n=1 Tax=Strongyloides papillosus TaxID=174720 RepID=A0A0N5BKM3_STREA